jgi:hypothetical protein
VAHVCNSSFSGGRVQEDRGSKLAWANSWSDPILKKILHENRASGVAHVVECVPSKPEVLSSNSSAEKKCVRFNNMGM